MNDRFRFSLLLVTWMLLLGCNDNQPSPQTQPKSLTIAVSTTPLSSPVFLAKRLGFFKKYGLNVELIEASGGVKCFDLLTQRQVDFATASDSVVMFQSFRRTDFTVISSFVESDNDLKLLSLTPSKFHNLQNIENARFGIIQNSASEYFLDSLLLLFNKQHIPIKRIYLKPDDLIPALMANQVDIISAWEPIGYQLSVKSEPQSTQLMSTRGLNHLFFNLITMKNNPNIDNHTKTRVLYALDDAIEYIADNPIKSQQGMSQALSIPQEQLQYSWDDYVFNLSMSNALISSVEAQARWAMESGIVAKDNRADLRTIIDKHLLETTLNRRVD
ncbi:ABC transporter substrate-binding protein [Shewanella maritima]|uniref:ABC transporter substrate-binding protein n=1 Tax=Shewanella maritima TaxID=2520507 RepID=UPI0037362DED